MKRYQQVDRYSKSGNDSIYSESQYLNLDSVKQLGMNEKSIFSLLQRFIRDLVTTLLILITLLDYYCIIMS